LLFDVRRWVDQFLPECAVFFDSQRRWIQIRWDQKQSIKGFVQSFGYSSWGDVSATVLSTENGEVQGRELLGSQQPNDFT
jgi:hypothetical protein